jgi:hypothetical protein
MAIRLGSPGFLRMLPTVVWALQLDEEATRANPAILRRLADTKTRTGRVRSDSTPGVASSSTAHRHPIQHVPDVAQEGAVS